MDWEEFDKEFKNYDKTEYCEMKGLMKLNRFDPKKVRYFALSTLLQLDELTTIRLFLEG